MKTLTLITSMLLLCLYSEAQVKQQAGSGLPPAVKNELKKEFSDIEAKGVKAKKTLLSDREAYAEITEYTENKWKKATKRSLSMTGTKYEEEYKKTADALYIELSKEIEASGNAKGEKQYFKIETVKIISDTTHYGVFYFDNNQNLVKYIHYK